MGRRGYRPAQAQDFAKERSKNSANSPRVNRFVWDAAKVCFEKQWSPEQISGRFKRENIGNISHETIYQRIYQNKKEGGTLHENLPVIQLPPGLLVVVRVPVYCVERGRWLHVSPKFKSASRVVPSSIRKTAVIEKNQSAVWSEISSMQQESGAFDGISGKKSMVERSRRFR